MELQVSQAGLTAAIVGAFSSIALVTVDGACAVKNGSAVIKGDLPVSKYIAKMANKALLGVDAAQTAEVEQWLAFLTATTDSAVILTKLNEVVASRTYLAGYTLSIADIALYVAVRAADTAAYASIVRWQGLCESQLPLAQVESVVGKIRGASTGAAPASAGALPPVPTPAAGAAAAHPDGKGPGGTGPNKEKGKNGAPPEGNSRDGSKTISGGGDSGAMPSLEGAEMGKVVTRFPPEPSGYLHIGHVKAVLLNDFYARHYLGKLIIRFDDTNPSKEKEEFEQNIIADLAALGVKGDIVTHTSDYFGVMEDYARQMLKDGLAFMDDTLQEQMRAERIECKDSSRRGCSIEENLARFEGMLKAGEEGSRWCMRAKINMQDLNGTLRDPVMYRCNDTPHHRTGTKYRAYPTYDFACPIVDSLEGVTHALRTLEYKDRDAQYAWIQGALRLRVVHIHEFSRLNFIYTLLSKRKLTWFADNGHVNGWYDPRFPTVQGVLRRGVTVAALREFILGQGASKRVLDMEWDKFWSTNKKHIDPVAPRYTAIADGPAGAGKVLVTLTGPGCPQSPEVRTVPLHPKNADIGAKPVWFTSAIYLEAEDVSSMKLDEEFTLMKWGNAYMRKVTKDANGIIVSAEAELHLEGDFKKTDKKVTWLAALGNAALAVGPETPNAGELVPMLLQDFDYLITVPKLEEGDDFQSAINPKTKVESTAFGEPSLRSVPAGTIIQLERKGFYRVDRALQSTEHPMILFAIPDGRVKTWGVGSPAFLAEVAAKEKTKKEVEKAAAEAAKKEAKMAKKAAAPAVPLAVPA